MWLAYLRFDSSAETRNALVRCGSRQEADQVLAAAKGVRAWELAEYALFYAHATIHARLVPNFPEELIFEAGDFLRRCKASGRSQEAGSADHPPGSSAGRTAPKQLGAASTLLPQNVSGEKL